MSMLVSSVAACACSHHSAAKAESKESCHSHSESASKHGEHTAAKGPALSCTGCSCEQVSPRLIFKQDQKQLQVKPVIARSPLTDPQFFVITADTAVDNFDTRSFSQSILRSSTPSRAPPRPKFV